MPTTHYNGREITTTLPRPTMRKALLAAERRGFEAAAKEADLPSKMVRYLCHVAGVEPAQHVRNAFVSYYPSRMRWRLSSGAAGLLGVGEGDAIKLQPQSRLAFLIGGVSYYEPTIFTDRNRGMMFRATHMARHMGLCDEDSSVRFKIEAQLDGYLARRT